MSSSKYSSRAVKDVEDTLRQSGLKLPLNAKMPLTSGYCPECDTLRELLAEEQNYYQGLIGILGWICKLGRLDIMVPVSLLSRYLEQAREGHLDQA